MPQLIRPTTHAIRRWRSCFKGATAIEYALIAAGIAMTLAAIIYGIGQDVYVNMFQRILDMFADF